LGQEKWGGSRQIMDVDSGQYIKLIFIFLFISDRMPCPAPPIIKGYFLPLALLLLKRFFSLDW